MLDGESKNAIQESKFKIGKKAFLSAALILLGLMIVSGVLTRVLPAGSYQRNIVDGRTMIINDSFDYVERPDYPIWRWFTSPIEVIFAPNNLALITIIIFILFVGGAIMILESSEVMKDMLGRLVHKFKKRKYLLMGIIIFIFMFLSAFLGIYEGLVPLIIFIVPLAHSLGWDSLTGLGMSLLPMSFGFAAAVTNPFTIGVAQQIAEIPLFSGAWLRIIFFFIVYVIVYIFVSKYAKKIEKDPTKSLVYEEDKTFESLDDAEEYVEKHEGMKKALTWFSCFMGLAILMVLAASLIPSMKNLAFPIMGILFLIGGIGAGLFARMGFQNLLKSFFKGWVNMAPGIVLILMAYSVKYIIDSGRITDTILYSAANLIADSPLMASAFMIYALTLIMNFFIGSASAKAFLMMPILTPLADLVGITRQTAVLAFDFGDGFSNMIFPSNALLLIALGFTVVSYPKWIRWTLKIQGIMLALTALFLAIAVLIEFGPV